MPSEITPEKQVILDRALAAPDLPASKVIIQKAKSRGWIKEEEQESSAQPKTPLAQTLGRMTEEGMSLGLAKHGRAAAGALQEALNPEPEQKGLSFYDRLERGLLSESGKEKKILRTMEKERPIISAGTKIAAGLVPAAPALVAGMAPAVLTGAGTGAISAVSEEKDPILGAAFGGAAGYVGVKAGDVIGKVADKLKNVASETVLKALKLAPTTMRRLRSKGNVLGQAKELADDMVKAGPAKNPATIRGLYDKTATVMKSTGEKLQGLYGEADEVLKAAGFRAQELDDIVSGALSKSQKYASPEEIAAATQEILAGLKGTMKKPDLYSALTKEAPDTVSPTKAWDFVKYLDDLSRQWERASDPAFASKADQLVDAASGIRAALIERIKNASPELAKEIALTSGLYRNIATAEGALSDQVIRTFSQNRSIPRMTLTEVAGSMLPGTPARLGAAKMTRGAAGAAGLAQRLAPAAAVSESARRQ